MRSEILSYLTATMTTSTIKVAVELPWNTAQEPLYLKNMKRFYLDQEYIEQTTLIPVLPGGVDVMQNDIICLGYLAVDAKNQPSGLSQAITTILGAKDYIGVDNFGLESDYTVEIQDDVLIYTVEYRMNTTA